MRPASEPVYTYNALADGIARKAHTQVLQGMVL